MSSVLLLSGGYVNEGSTAHAMILSLLEKYPDIFPFTLDGRFFGLISSEAERTFNFLHEKGCVTDNYNVLYGEPIHSLRRLKEKGEEQSRRLVNDPLKLKEYNFPQNLVDLAAEILSVTAVPKDISTAWSLYLSDVINDNFLDRVQVKESVAKPITIYHAINTFSIYELVERIKRMEDGSLAWLIGVDDVKKISENIWRTYYKIPFYIKKDGIRNRYDYLTLTEESLRKNIDLFESAESKRAKEELLLSESGRRLFKTSSMKRQDAIKKLIKHYPTLPEDYVASCLSKMEIIKKNYGTIHESYDHIFKFLEKIAELSSKYWEEPELQLYTKIITLTFSSSSIYVPKELKDELMKDPYLIDGGWNFGTDYHVNHIPQFFERIYLLDLGYGDYVDDYVNVKPLQRID